MSQLSYIVSQEFGISDVERFASHIRKIENNLSYSSAQAINDFFLLHGFKPIFGRDHNHAINCVTGLEMVMPLEMTPRRQNMLAAISPAVDFNSHIVFGLQGQQYFEKYELGDTLKVKVAKIEWI